MERISTVHHMLIELGGIASTLVNVTTTGFGATALNLQQPLMGVLSIETLFANKKRKSLKS